jgi:hypothetical protein
LDQNFQGDMAIEIEAIIKAMGEEVVMRGRMRYG